MSQSPAENASFDAWNPGLTSALPPRLLPLVTLFRPENSAVGYADAKEAADFCGLPVEELCALKTERLVVHEVLIRVTADLSVPDGPSYEYLGLQLRAMVDRIYQHYMVPQIGDISAAFDAVCNQAAKVLDRLVSDAFDQGAVQTAASRGLLGRFFGPKTQVPVTDSDLVERWRNRLGTADDLTESCLLALLAVSDGIMGKQGKMVRDKALITRLALRVFRNDYGSRAVGQIIAPLFVQAAKAEGYRFLPAQTDPIVMNTKGASASGKSTIRPKQRMLAEKMGIPWEDFALISPDYWRKYLLDYDSMGDDYKYAAMLTGRELEFVDKKLDRYMAQKAVEGTVPHLLIDRFRFDSFKTDSDGDSKSTLLSRFGSTVFLFFIITPPAATVERAWQRGLTTARYKAVDDLLYHNIEAFTGIPELFFSWMTIKDKEVYFEFLDNDVHLGALQRTIAFGRNDHMTVLDPVALSNIDRFKEVNIAATQADEVLNPSWTPTWAFLQQCVSQLPHVTFADFDSAAIYGAVDHGRWSLQNPAAVPSGPAITPLLAALGWHADAARSQPITVVDVVGAKRVTLGAWAASAQ